MPKKKPLDSGLRLGHARIMAVYTKVSSDDLSSFLGRYDAGILVSYEGIAAGVSNTNYFVTTDRDRYVLTLFEPHRVKAEDLDSFMAYAIRLEKGGVPCPRTLVQKDGAVYSTLCDRPAALFSVLQGQGGTPELLTPEFCARAGAILAKMHKTVEGQNFAAPNHFGLSRWQKWTHDLGPDMDRIAPGLSKLVQEEVAFVTRHWPTGLPAGAIHADYFPDNVFFNDNGDVTGVIDFHFVCHDFFAYDFAIAVNAWCFDPSNAFVPARMASMMRGYQSVRPLSQAETDFLPVLLRGASLRFLLSRIEEKLKWKEGDFVTPHDPMVFETRLRHFQSSGALPEVLSA